MCFDVLKVVRSPGYDPKHDEESLNGRDVKIDIWKTMFGHRKCFGRFRTFTGVPGGYRNPPGSILGLMGLSGEEEGPPGQAAAPPPPLVLIGQGRGVLEGVLD